MLTITPVEAPLGATVTGLDLHRPLDRDVVAALRAALADHEVLFFPEACLDPAEQVRFGESFGPVERHAVIGGLPDHPEVTVLDSEPTGRVADGWHTDVTCAPAPPMGSVLQMVVAPPSGGATHWASMTAAYETLDDDTRQRVDGFHALHRSWWKPVQEHVHPVVRTHPENGRRALFVNRLFTKRIVELEAADSDELLATLFAHAAQPELTVTHAWRAGDIAFWDNRSTQHRADADFGGARRIGHRVTIAGDEPR